MSIDRKHLVTGALLAFVAVTTVTLAVKEAAHARAVAAAEASRASAPGPAPPEIALPAPVETPATIFVTYFHTTARCMSCLKIEDLTNATMSTRFAGPIAEKRVVWRVLNVDEPENNHFVKDGREVRWKNLEEVWNLLGDPAAFQGYVEREVQAFLDAA